MELGIGAGWKRDEWLAYGYGFPETKERLARLGRRPRGDHGDARRRQAPARHVRGPARPRPRRDQRPEADPAAARPDHGRRQRPERDLAPGCPPRRRAQPRRHDRRPRWPRRCRSSAQPLRGDRPRPGQLAVSVHVWREQFGIGGPARIDLPRRLSRRRCQPGHGPRRGLARRPTRRSSRWPRTRARPASSSPEPLVAGSAGRLRRPAGCSGSGGTGWSGRSGP